MKSTKKAIAVLGSMMLLQTIASPIIASAKEVPYYYVNNNGYENLKEAKEEVKEEIKKTDKWNSIKFEEYNLSNKKGDELVPTELFENITPFIHQLEVGLYKNIKDVTFNDIRNFKGVYNKETKIVGLDLKGQELYKLPSIIKEMKELRFLDLSENPIKDIPQWLVDFNLDLETKLKISDLVSDGKLKINKPKAKEEKKIIEEKEVNNIPSTPGEIKKEKTYETWNRVPQKPIITSAVENKSNSDKYVSIDNKVVDATRDKPKDEKVQPITPIEEANGSKLEPDTKISEEPKVLPQTGALIGTNAIAGIGIVLASIGGFLFKRKKLN